MHIRIYVSDHCFSCQEVISFFKEQGIATELINVTREQNRFDEMVRFGGIATPFIIIGEHIFHSFDQTIIEKVLEGIDE